MSMGDSWNFRLESQKADAIQGWTFGEEQKQTIPDTYGHIANYDALVDYGADFQPLEEKSSWSKTPAFAATKGLGDIVRQGSGVESDKVSQRDIAMRTSGRGFDELDMQIKFYGRTNHYDIRGLKSSHEHRDMNVNSAIKDGINHAHQMPYVASELAHLSEYDVKQDAPDLAVPNGAYAVNAAAPSSIHHMEQKTYARADFDAKDASYSHKFESVRTLDDGGDLSSGYYAAEERTEMMKRALFVDRSYGAYGTSNR
jgi:hypothetical protein